MILVRLLFYLLQFYLFVLTGAVAYLCARAWVDPTVAGTKGHTPRWMGHWGHFGRALTFSVLTFAAMLGALYQGAVGIHADKLVIARYVAYVVICALLPRQIRTSPRVIIGGALVLVGEVLNYFLIPISNVTLRSSGMGLPIASVGLLDLGVTLVALAMQGVCFRIRVIDRLVIAFAVLSMFIAQLVVVLFLGLVVSIGNGLTRDQMQDLIDHADQPVVITLVAVLVMSAIIGYFIARDISAPMMRVERALRAIGRGELDYRVQLRGSGDDEMHDLAREVNRMAASLKDAESMRAEFFSFVSHELRSPLTSIRGFIQTLEADPEFSDDDRQEIYKIIHDEADRLLRMIGELLDVARIEAGRPITLQTRRMDCGRHLEKVVEIMRAHTNRHRLLVKRPQAPVWIEADPDKFDQILINLLSNAIKYSPDGGDIEAILDVNEQSVTVAIKDPGVGMTSAQAEHIFDKYYRVSDQEKAPARLSRVEGSGIGLYLTRALVEAHGGEILVQTKLGQGSTFSVVLPRTHASAGATDQAESTALQAPQPSAGDSGRTSAGPRPLVSGPAVE